MSGDTSNPRIWEGADVYVAPLATDAPTDVSGAWPAGWDPLGLLHEDGATLSRPMESTTHKAWGGAVFRSTVTPDAKTLVVTALEDNPTVFALVNPGSEAVADDGVTTRTIKVPTAANVMALGLETVDGEYTRRLIFPRAQLTSIGDETMSASEPSSRELTFTILADSDEVEYYEITDDPQADPDWS